MRGQKSVRVRDSTTINEHSARIPRPIPHPSHPRRPLDEIRHKMTAVGHPRGNPAHQPSSQSLPECVARNTSEHVGTRRNSRPPQNAKEQQKRRDRNNYGQKHHLGLPNQRSKPPRFASTRRPPRRTSDLNQPGKPHRPFQHTFPLTPPLAFGVTLFPLPPNATFLTVT